MAETPHGTGQVTDHRTSPRGVIPRRMQMWLLVGLAFGILSIILFTGQPQPPARALPAAALQPPPLDADRLRDYQQRLRLLDERARQEPVTQPMLARPEPVYAEPPSAPAADPLDSEQKRRNYESLFASNVVISRRPDADQLMNVGSAVRRRAVASTQTSTDGIPAPPSLDEVADAVMRASERYTPPSVAASAETASQPSRDESRVAPEPGSPGVKGRPAATGPIASSGPQHRILEGTVLETVLTNRVDGGAVAPVNCLVTTPVYSHDGYYVLIPAGSRVLGETKPVQGFGATRLAVAFDRLVLPDGRTYPLNQFMGLNDIGDAGLRDQVNQHYRSTFGASAAVGLITGFAQYLGSLGLNRGSDRTVVIAGNLGDATAQASAQTMNRFLNRLPTITIREGHRVKVYLTSDLELPAYAARGDQTRPLAGIR